MTQRGKKERGKGKKERRRGEERRGEESCVFVVIMDYQNFGSKQ